MRRHWLGAAMASALVAFGLAACGTGTPNSTSGGLQIWEGYTGAEAKAFTHLLDVWNKAHPTEKVSYLYVDNDDSLPKLLTAVKGGSHFSGGRGGLIGSLIGAAILTLLLKDQTNREAPEVPKVKGPSPKEVALAFFHQMQEGKVDRDKLGEEFSLYLTISVRRSVCFICT
jgi:ABC-type glycerol-3-phosphate transport system substrate-binding protein